MKRSLRKSIIFLFVAFIIVLLSTGCGDSTVPEETQSTETEETQSTETEETQSGEVLELKLAHGLPETSMTGLQYNSFCEFLEEESNGSIVVEQHIGGSLLSDTETLDAVMDGQVDFIHSMVAYASGTIKDISPLEVPGYYSGDNYLEFAAAVHDILEDIYADYDIKYLGSNYQGTSNLVCTKKQIKEPSDMQGLAFRTAGTWMGKAIEAWGASPTTIPLGDLTTALERGTVDGSYNGWSITGPFKLYEIADYVTYTNMAETFGNLLMSKKTWDSMNAEQQAAVERAAERYIEESYNIGMDFYQQYYDEMAEYGTNIYTLTPEEKEEFVDISAGVYDEVSETCTDKGKELIEILVRLNE